MKKEIIEPRTLKGFMELLPKEQIIFNEIYNTIRDVYELYGFLPLDTPVIERQDVLLAKAGGETEKQIYKFTKGDTDMALRFDQTVPLAKYVAKNYNELTFPFRRYQISKVFRGERPQQGRFRELYQADIDIIGDEKLDVIYDAEIPSIIYSIFRKLDIGKFLIRTNNRKILNGLYEYLELSNISQDIIRIIDKIDKIGKEEVKKLLLELVQDEEKVEKIMEITLIEESNFEKVEKLRTLGIENEKFNQGLYEIEEVLKYAKTFGISDDYIKFDMTIARGLDYYTGTVYEVFIEGLEEIGSVCSGGRYDNLAEYYTDKKLPGVGISIGLTRLFDRLYNYGRLKISKNYQSQIIILPLTNEEKYITKSIEIANYLRQNSISCEIYLEDKKLKQKFKYANNLNIPYTIVIGDEEIEDEFLTIKNMKTGNQEKIKKEQILDLI